MNNYFHLFPFTINAIHSFSERNINMIKFSIRKDPRGEALGVFVFVG